MSLISDIKNKLYNSAGFKAVTGQDYLSTSYGSDFIPEYTVTDSQKRYSTSASIPNLPKPETMFFVYFNLNAKAQMLINKKRALIEYLSKLVAQQESNKELAAQQESQKKSAKGVIEYVSNSIDKVTSSLANSFEYAKKENPRFI